MGGHLGGGDVAGADDAGVDIPHEDEKEDHGDLDVPAEGSDEEGIASGHDAGDVSDPEDVVEEAVVELALALDDAALALVPVAAGGGGGGGGGGPGGVGAEIEAPFGCGYIVYYPKTQRFMAYCNINAHRGVKCNRTRMAVAGARQCKGRPLGLLAAWLQHGNVWTTKEEHCEVGIHQTLASRRGARDLLLDRAAAGDVAIATLLARERPQRPDEPAEPLEQP